MVFPGKGWDFLTLVADQGPYRAKHSSTSLFPRLLLPNNQGDVDAGCGFCAFEKLGPATTISFAPTSGGKASSFLDYEQRAIFRNWLADILPEKRPTLLILHMDPAVRQVCMYSGVDALMEGGDVMLVVQVLRDFSQPDAADRFFSQVGKFTSYIRA